MFGGGRKSHRNVCQIIIICGLVFLDLLHRSISPKSYPRPMSKLSSTLFKCCTQVQRLNSTSADTRTGRLDVALRNMNTYLAYCETYCFPDKMLCYSNYRQCDDFVKIYPYKKVKRLVFGVLSNYLAAWFLITVHTHC